MKNSESVLAKALEDWRPGTVTLTRRVDPWFAEAFAGLIGAPDPGLRPGDPLPPLWHWFTLLEHPRTADLGEDGHIGDGAFLPPIPGRRRMFAGGRLHAGRPVPVGGDLSGESKVTSVALKNGRSGEMAFVTTRTELSVGGETVGAEEQDIVYRSEPPGTGAPGNGSPENGPRRMERPAATEPEPEGDWRLSLETDPVLLARFSALTYNGHRIHYDKPYTTETEGYPDLVIHGPLLALLALELPRRNAPGKTLTDFEYRLVRPAFVPARIIAAGQLTGQPAGNQATLNVAAAGVTPSLTATATFA